MLLEERVDVNTQGGKYGNTLQATCAKGRKNIIGMLVKKGADVNAQGGYYGNALRAACATGQYEIVRMLVEEGAELNARVNTMAMLAKLPLTTATMKFKLLLKWNMPHV
jgi:ankyrin repeat protein